jgi:hypothetical protein
MVASRFIRRRDQRVINALDGLELQGIVIHSNIICDGSNEGELWVLFTDGRHVPGLLCLAAAALAALTGWLLNGADYVLE